MIVGHFQSEAGQFGCISCDNLGDFYQELPGQTSCILCATHTQRYIGVLSATNRSSCQCKEGEVSREHCLLLSLIGCSLLLCRLLQRKWPARRGAASLTFCHGAVCLDASKTNSALWSQFVPPSCDWAGVRTMYSNRRSSFVTSVHSRAPILACLAPFIATSLHRKDAWCQVLVASHARVGTIHPAQLVTFRSLVPYAVVGLA